METQKQIADLLTTMNNTLQTLQEMQKDTNSRMEEMQKENGSLTKTLIELISKPTAESSTTKDISPEAVAEKKTSVAGTSPAASESESKPLFLIDKGKSAVKYERGTVKGAKYIPDTLGTDGDDEDEDIGDDAKSVKIESGEFVGYWPPGLNKPPGSMHKPKPTRPKIEAHYDDISWNIFKQKWKQYKSITGIHERKEVCLELMEACSEQVERLLYQVFGAIDVDDKRITEKVMLKYIKKVAVDSLHPQVHRWTYNQLNQMDGEPVMKYVARLKSQATLCKFNVKCGCGENVSYSDDMIAQKLTTSLINQEHQAKILTESEQLPELGQKVNRLVSLETTDDAMLKIRNVAKMGAARQSGYKKEMKERERRGSSPSHRRGRQRDRQDTSQRQREKHDDSYQKPLRKRCRGCGRFSHSNGRSRRSECPAIDQSCNSCGKIGHFAKVCDKRQSSAAFVRCDDDTSCSEPSMTEDEYTSEGELSQTENVTIGKQLAVKSSDFRYRVSNRFHR